MTNLTNKGKLDEKGVEDGLERLWQLGSGDPKPALSCRGSALPPRRAIQSCILLVLLGIVEDVEGFDLDSPHPEDEVGGKQVHETKVGSAPVVVDLDPRAQDDCSQLQQDKDEAQTHCQLNLQRAGVVHCKPVNDAENEVDEGAKAEDDSADSDEGRTVGWVPLNWTWRSGENQKEIDQEDVWSTKQKDEDPDSDSVTVGATFAVRLGVGDHACAGGHDVDGQEEEAVDDGEGW